MKHPFQVKKILIPLDFSKTSTLALEHAAHLCKAFGSELHLLHIYNSSTVDVLPNLKAVSAQVDNRSEILQLVSDEMDAIGKRFKDKFDVHYSIEVREGAITKEITKEAKEIGADLIVMGTHGVSGFEEFFIGSNAYRTVTSAPIPVLTVQAHAERIGFKNIVLPVDGTQHTRDKVSQAVTFAEAFDSTVHIVGLYKKEDEEDQAVFNLKMKQIEDHFDHKGIKHTTEHLHGDNIAKLTMNYAEKINADLTIIMTDQENYTGFFVGPYAQRIVNHSKIPVLSVTPLGVVKGFSQAQLGGDYRPFNI